MPSYFITGTDTGVGKTYFTGWLVRAWLAQGRRAVALKPIATGNRDDAKALREALGGVLTLDEINPVHFRKAASPLVAANAENRTIDFHTLKSEIGTMQKRHSHLAVEGVGGWRVPLAPNYTVREWARDLGLPVVIVARGTLGTLNHTLLTADSIRATGLTCAGIVVNAAAPEIGGELSPNLDLARSENVLLLREILGLPVLDFDRRAEASGNVPVWLGGE